MNLLLIRHTEPHLIDGVCYGQTEVPIKIQEYLKKRKQIYQQIIQMNLIWNVIYSSPLLRCKYLANYLQRKLNLGLVLHNSLKEFNYGLWEGKSFTEIENEFKIWANHYKELSTPQGESLNEFYKRSYDFYKQITNLNQNIIVVTHLGVIRGFYLIYHNLPIDDFFLFKIGYGELLLLKFY